MIMNLLNHLTTTKNNKKTAKISHCDVINELYDTKANTRIDVLIIFPVPKTVLLDCSVVERQACRNEVAGSNLLS